jgi:hypothetical protein
MCSFNAEASLCVGDAILVVSIYILVVFLDRSSFEGLRYSVFRLLGLPVYTDEFVRGYVLFW